MDMDDERLWIICGALVLFMAALLVAMVMS